MPYSHSPQYHFYKQSLSLLTDLYQLTMAYGYWKAGFTGKQAVYHLFFRKNPFGGGFSVAAGLESAIDYIQNFRYDSSDIDYLASLRGYDDQILFDPAFFDYLSGLKLTCDIDAVPEGSLVFPYEPLVRVSGPLIQCQLLESPLLNLINFPTLIATKAARICIAAMNDPVLEFGIRRAQGIDGALTATRSAFIGGCTATSNVCAGKLFGIPVKGTQAHSWVMVFDDEETSFQTYAAHMPNNCILLVDTYNTIEGVKKAIEVGKRLHQEGKKLIGIRLDSGDLAYLSIQSRMLLDEAGLHGVLIFASNDLDEIIIDELKKQGARIDVWAVGTRLATGGSQAALDGVYKLSAVQDPGGPWKYKLKLSEQQIKVSNPGILQVKRYFHDGYYVADAIYDILMGLPDPGIIVDPFDATKIKGLNKKWESRDLLIPVFREGKCVYETPSLAHIQMMAKKELSMLHNSSKRFLNPHTYVVGIEKNLYDLKTQLIMGLRQ